ncbi:MAG: formylglycine-generating enzyme family protein [Akkermansiaceae bacterium]
MKNHPSARRVVHALIAATSIAITASSSLVAQSISMDFVTVGNTGNAADSNGYGAVNYSYGIGKFEVTNAQYTTFLNAVAQSDPNGLYHFYHDGNPTVEGISRSGSSGSYTYSVVGSTGNNPVAYVNWFDAARFANWMHNGMGSGSTESGVYDLSLTGIARMTASNGAKFRLATPDEWYKAAYYDPNKDGTGGYWMYPTQSNAIPTDAPGAGTNNANFAITPDNTNPRVTPVGAHTGSPGAYGTYDMGGNLYEWINQTTDGGDAFAKGGGWAFGHTEMQKTNFGTIGNYTLAGGENDHNGFRLVSTSVPEPSSALIILLASVCSLFLRSR